MFKRELGCPGPRQNWIYQANKYGYVDKFHVFSYHEIKGKTNSNNMRAKKIMKDAGCAHAVICSYQRIPSAGSLSLKKQGMDEREA